MCCLQSWTMSRGPAEDAVIAFPIDYACASFPFCVSWVLDGWTMRMPVSVRHPGT